MGRRVPVTAIVFCGVLFCAYMGCLVAFAPATVLDAILVRSAAGTLRLAEADGTLWAGKGRLEARDALGTKGIGTDLAWHFEPQLLLRGRLGFQVRLAGATKRLSLGFFPGGVEIEDADFFVPASVLGLVLPRMALIGPSGELHVQAARLTVAGRNPAGQAVVTWQSAGVALAPVSPLGDYEFRLESVSAGWDASLRTLKGPLQLTGKGSSRDNRPFVFKINARVEPQMQSQLVPFLRLIAIEREPGNFELQIDRPIGPTGPAALRVLPSRPGTRLAELPDPEFQLDRDRTLDAILDRRHDHQVSAYAFTLDRDGRQRRNEPAAIAVVGVAVEGCSNHTSMHGRTSEPPVQGPPPVRPVLAALAVAVDKGPAEQRMVRGERHFGAHAPVVAAELPTGSEMLGIETRIHPDLRVTFFAADRLARGHGEDRKRG